MMSAITTQPHVERISKADLSYERMTWNQIVVKMKRPPACLRGCVLKSKQRFDGYCVRGHDRQT